MLSDHRCDLKGNAVASHPEFPGSIPCRINFLVEVSSVVFLNCKPNVTKFRPQFVSEYDLAIMIIQNYIHPSTGGDATTSDLRCSAWPTLNNIISYHTISYDL